MNSRRSAALATVLLLIPCVAIATPAVGACLPTLSEVLDPGTSFDFYGSHMAASGSTLVVGAPFADAVYVYDWDGSNWVESQVLSEGIPDGEFGSGVAIDGDWIVVGAPKNGGHGHPREAGTVYFFHFDGAQWVKTQEVFASDADKQDHFGNAVGLGGTVAVVGAAEDEQGGFESGSAYVLRHNGSTWVQEQKLLAFDGARQDHYGRNVAVATAVSQVFVASSNAAGSGLGAVYAYAFDGAAWNYVQKLLPTTPAQAFGDAMAVEGSVAVIGAQGADIVGSDSGAAFVFRHDGTSWVREQRLLASDAGDSDRFGWSVAILGDLIAVGAHNDGDQGFNVGSAYLFQHTTKWRQAAKVYPSGGEVNGYFGSAVALAESTLVVGQEGADAAHVFDVSSCQP